MSIRPLPEIYNSIFITNGRISNLFHIRVFLLASSAAIQIFQFSHLKRRRGGGEGGGLRTAKEKELSFVSVRLTADTCSLSSLLRANVKSSCRRLRKVRFGRIRAKAEVI